MTGRAFVADLVDEALRLAAEATPGPWSVRAVAETYHRGEDARFIAFARTALPALAERLHALRTEAQDILRADIGHLGAPALRRLARKLCEPVVWEPTPSSAPAPPSWPGEGGRSA